MIRDSRGDAELRGRRERKEVRVRLAPKGRRGRRGLREIPAIRAHRVMLADKVPLADRAHRDQLGRRALRGLRELQARKGRQEPLGLQERRVFLVIAVRRALPATRVMQAHRVLLGRREPRVPLALPGIRAIRDRLAPKDFKGRIAMSTRSADGLPQATVDQPATVQDLMTDSSKLAEQSAGIAITTVVLAAISTHASEQSNSRFCDRGSVAGHFWKTGHFPARGSYFSASGLDP